MKDRSFQFHDGQMGAAITVRITAHASHNEISGILDDGTIKIRLTASQAVEKSNQALISFLAEILGIDPRQLEIIAGASGSNKLVTIVGMDKWAVQEHIMAHLS